MPENKTLTYSYIDICPPTSQGGQPQPQDLPFLTVLHTLPIDSLNRHPDLPIGKAERWMRKSAELLSHLVEPQDTTEERFVAQLYPNIWTAADYAPGSVIVFERAKEGHRRNPYIQFGADEKDVWMAYGYLTHDSSRLHNKVKVVLEKDQAPSEDAAVSVSLAKYDALHPGVLYTHTDATNTISPVSNNDVMQLRDRVVRLIETVQEYGIVKD